MGLTSTPYCPATIRIPRSRELGTRRPGAAAERGLGVGARPGQAQGPLLHLLPGLKDGHVTNHVVHADSIHGPWSDPIDLKIGDIDPGHVAGPDGKRYLFMGGGGMVPLAADGLSVVGQPKKVYAGWQYPDDRVVTAFALEGPKPIRHGGYYHMLVAEGGTAGPPTSHMVVSARARSLDGPWENSPYNQGARTTRRAIVTITAPWS